MLCAAWTLLKNGHVRIDLLTVRLRKRTRDLIDVFGHIVFLIPFAALMVMESYPFAMRAFAIGESSSNAGGLVVWPAKMLILLGFALLLLQAISELIKRIAILLGKLDDPESERSQAC